MEHGRLFLIKAALEIHTDEYGEKCEIGEIPKTAKIAALLILL